MWIFTTDGFFSIVKSDQCGDDELAVRARVHKDLERFLDQTGFQADILEFPQGDYHYMVLAPADVVAAYLADEVKAVDYPNFKDACQRIAGGPARARAHALHSVWSAMMGLQETA